MSVNRVQKEALIGATITFDAEADTTPDVINPSSPSNFVDVISLDGLDGAPVIPTVGTYEIHVQTDVDGGFKSIADNGSLAAGKTGGSALVDGIAEGGSFTGLPLKIKIVPTGVDVAVAYRAIVKQVSVQ